MAASSDQLRVFISSTFSDMNAERDALNAIFPQIKEICKKRGIDFVPIDLRWGVTEEAAKQGRVIDTCMREIDNSRPFFIGLVGHRYGWMPTEADLGFHYESLRRQYPWLDEALRDHTSITEMEMLYATVSEQSRGMNAAFFLREENVDVPAEYKEVPGSEGEKKLRALRHKLLHQNTHPVSHYKTPDELAAQVKTALQEFINREYPEADVKGYDIEMKKQERILNSRLNSLFDLSRYQEDFDRWVASDSQWLLVNGLPGRGKSYLVTQFARQLLTQNGKNIVMYADCSTFNDLDSTVEYVLTETLHNLGVSTRHESDKSETWGCLGNILLFIFKFPFLILKTMFIAAFKGDKQAGEALGEALAENVGSMSSSNLKRVMDKTVKAFDKGVSRPVYVIWDNIDAFSDESMPFFYTYTEILPMRNIATARTDSTADAYLRASLKATQLQVKNLTDVQARTYVEKYLATFGKQLTDGQYQKIVKSQVAGVPKLLTLILDLLVNFGSYEQLDEYINQLTAVANVKDVYELTIRNIAKIFPGEQGGEAAVDILMALTVVPGGLTEEEIREIFEPTPMAWANISPYLTNICMRVGNKWKLDNKDMILAAYVAIVDMEHAANVVNKVSQHFEKKLTTRVMHKFKYTNGVDASQIVEDTYTFKRQVEVLLPLYYLTGNSEQLYYWVTYLDSWSFISERQGLDYWRLLYKDGYTMRESDGYNVYPAKKRSITSYCGVTQKNQSKRTNLLYLNYIREYENCSDIIKIEDDRKNEIFMRWLSIASNLFCLEDVKWLQNGTVILKDDEAENEEILMEVQVLQQLLNEDKYDDIISRIGRVHTTDVMMDATLNSNYSLAYFYKDMGPESLKYSKNMFGDLEKADALMVKECMSFIIVHVTVICKFRDMAEIDRVLPLVEAQYEICLKEGLNQESTFFGTQSMALMMKTKGDKVRALEAANAWLAASKALNFNTEAAQNFINNL